MDHTGIHLEVTLKLKIDWPKTTAAEFIEIMDRRYHLDSLDMGDAAGALVKAFVEGDFVFAMDTDQVFDWTGTSEAYQRTLVDHTENDKYVPYQPIARVI